MSECLQKLRPRSLDSGTKGKPVSSPNIKRSRSLSEGLNKKRKVSKLTKRKRKQLTSSQSSQDEQTEGTNASDEEDLYLSKSAVDRALTDAGVKNVDEVCLCVKAAISKGHISLDMPAPLKQVLLRKRCPQCSEGHRIKVRLKDVLYQSDRGDFYCGFDSNIECSNCDSQLAVMSMCYGQPTLNSGKQYNHCSLCPGFGRCIGDYRKGHCDCCNRHYYAGSLGESSCRYCYSSDSDSDSWREKSQPEIESPEAIFSYLYSRQETKMRAAMHSVQAPHEPDISTLNFPDSDTD